VQNFPLVILDDATAGSGRLLRYRQPSAVIRADSASEAGPALVALEAALAAGKHVAGWLGYELGYALEPHLAPLQWPQGGAPLLWFGVFDAPEPIARADLVPAGRAYAGPLRHEWDAAAYSARFAKVHDYIEAGDIYQANLSFRSRFRFVGDSLALYLQLRDRAQAAHCAFIDDGERQILSLSPELFFKIDGHGQIMARPMKGTAPRGTDDLSDARAKASLGASPKDRAENLMIVDLVRNDVGRLALIGTVGVKDLFAVETYPTLHTMVSTVTATLKPATRVEQIVRALFPCGSITGAPKIRAMEIIRAMEQGPRGLYCGAIGTFAPDGSARFNVAIRTITVAGGQGELGIGGAVVQDSNAEAEYAECLLKARYFEVARRPVGLIETLRWSPREGFVRLDRHLDRMARSSAAFGIPFDRAVAKRELKRLAIGADAPLRLRIQLNEDGSIDSSKATLAAGPERWRYAISPRPTNSADLLLRHKTTWRGFYDDVLARLSKDTGCDEVLFINERGEITEGSRTNIFVRHGMQLLTPPLSSGVLDGVLRAELIANGQCSEAVLTPEDLAAADEVLLGNSLRGLISAVPVPLERAARL
jgi:para-aminobenzoate synthetase / 4-amino-4-deoxychorismate lyase